MQRFGRLVRCSASNLSTELSSLNRSIVGGNRSILPLSSCIVPNSRHVFISNETRTHGSAVRLFSAEASASTQKQFSPKVAKLVEEITALNLLEVSELVQQLKTTLNLPDTPMGMPMAMPMAAPAAAPAEEAAAAAPKEEKATVTIQLDGFDEASKIKLIKEVKGITNLGLKEAKALVESKPPVAIMKDVKREEAQNIAKLLKENGAKISLV